MEISLTLKVGHIGSNILTCHLEFQIQTKTTKKNFCLKVLKKKKRPSLTLLRSHTANFTGGGCKTTALLVFFLENESTLTQINEYGHTRGDQGSVE